MPGEKLTDDVRAILGRAPKVIVEAGVHWGHTALNYLDAFPEARIWGFEAETENFAKGREGLAKFGDQVRLWRAALAGSDGALTLHVNSHHGTHSLLPIGEQRYWGAFAESASTQDTPAIRLDTLMRAEEIEQIDLLHMDIQGGELEALRGGEDALRRGAISLVYCEVEFYELYKKQPLFWDLATYLRQFGYQFYSLYDRYYHEANPAVLSWADALFVAPRYLTLPEHARPRPD